MIILLIHVYENKDYYYYYHSNYYIASCYEGHQSILTAKISINY